MRFPWRKRGRSFAVWSHINGLNHGDELVVETVIAELLRRVPDASIMTVSMFPPSSEERHGWPSHRIGGRPIGASDWPIVERLPNPMKGLARKAKSVFHEVTSWFSMIGSMARYDTLVIAGSGPLEDDPGCAFRLWKWVVAARLTGARVAVLSVGAGPLDKPVNQRFVDVALRLAHYTSVRDESSVSVLRGAGIERDIQVRPDQGWLWPPLPREPSAQAVTGKRIGVNVMSLNDPRQDRGIPIGAKDYDRFDTYIGELLGFVEHAVNAGNEVVLYSTETHHDVRVAHEFIDMLVERDRCDATQVSNAGSEDSTAVDALGVVRCCDVNIATRFHSALIGLATGRTTVALAYHPKTFDLFARLGLGEFALDADTFAAKDLIDCVDRAIAAPLDRRAASLVEVGRIRDELALQFDSAVALGS